MKNPIFILSLNIILLSSAVVVAQSQPTATEVDRYASSSKTDSSYADTQIRPEKDDVDAFIEETEIKFDNNEGKANCYEIAKLFYEHKAALDASRTEFKDDAERDDIRLERVKRLFELLDYCHEAVREDMQDYKVSAEK